MPSGHEVFAGSIAGYSSPTHQLLSGSRSFASCTWLGVRVGLGLGLGIGLGLGLGLGSHGAPDLQELEEVVAGVVGPEGPPLLARRLLAMHARRLLHLHLCSHARPLQRGEEVHLGTVRVRVRARARARARVRAGVRARVGLGLGLGLGLGCWGEERRGSVHLLVREVGVPDVEYEHDARVHSLVPRLVLEGVVEDLVRVRVRVRGRGRGRGRPKG